MTGADNDGRAPCHSANRELEAGLTADEVAQLQAALQKMVNGIDTTSQPALGGGPTVPAGLDRIPAARWPESPYGSRLLRHRSARSADLDARRGGLQLRRRPCRGGPARAVFVFRGPVAGVLPPTAWYIQPPVGGSLAPTPGSPIPSLFRTAGGLAMGQGEGSDTAVHR